MQRLRPLGPLTMPLPRTLIEQILAEEEQHLRWLDTEITLYETLGESLYASSRLRTGLTSAA